MVFLTGAAADSQASDDPAIDLQRNAAAENDDLSAVHLVHPVEGAAGLGQDAQLFRGHFHGHRSVGLLHCHVKAYEESAVHDVNGDRISLGPADGDHRLFAAASGLLLDLLGQLLRCLQIDLPVVVDPS